MRMQWLFEVSGDATKLSAALKNLQSHEGEEINPGVLVISIRGEEIP